MTSVRQIFLWALTAVAVVPLLLLVLFWIWPHSVALEEQLDEVRNRNLLMARSVAAALTRYDQDVKAVFTMVAENALNNREIVGIDTLLMNLHFRHICIFDSSSYTLRASITRAPFPCPDAVPQVRRAMFKSVAVDNQPRFTEVAAAPDGQPAIFLAALFKNRLIVGAIDTTYFRSLSQNIVFGERGHAVIVDRQGRAISHPSDDWTQQMRDLSQLEAVQMMMQGGTGITRFYSPALQMEMVAGYTFVPGPGWGVMVPQPILELEQETRQVVGWTIAILIVGLMIAIVVGWLLARMLLTPLRQLSRASKRIADAQQPVQIPPLSANAPAELVDLHQSFNQMSAALSDFAQQQAEARALAEQANNTKSQFLASVSHELRTPLNAIIGFTDVMRQGAFGPIGAPQYQDYLENVYTSGRQLLALISDLLDLSKIESGKVALEEKRTDIVAVIQGGIEMVQIMAREKNITIDEDLNAPVPLLWVDPRALQQIMLNLLSNAVKFCRNDGQITVHAKTLESGAFEIRVSDNGIGIPEDALLSVLEPFQQSGAGSKREQGSGLGLAIVRALMSHHDGHIRLESKIDEGTEAILTFPKFRVLDEYCDPPSLTKATA